MNNHYDYQDIWIRGQVKKKGQRECNERYEVIKKYLSGGKGRNLSVLDFGANNGYFSFRLAEDFPEYDIHMVDGSNLLPLLKDLNSLDNVYLYNEIYNEQQLMDLVNENDFDYILMMSILHHFENPYSIIDFLSKKRNKTIFEISYPDEKDMLNPPNKKRIFDYLQKFNPIQINRNIRGHDRPIYYIGGEDIIFKGIIHSGANCSGDNISNRFKEDLLEKTNTIFFPGTLNVKLDRQVVFKNLLYITDNCGIFPVRMNGVDMWTILSPVKLYKPIDEIEIIYQHNIKNLFHYQDGDELTVAINKRFIDQIFV